MRIFCALIAALLVTGCGTLNKQMSDAVAKDGDSARTRVVASAADPLQKIDPPSRVVLEKVKIMPAVPVVGGRAAEWLRKYRVEKFETTNPVPLSAIQKWLTEQGINVVSDMPLDSVTFSGKINPTDAETALKAIAGSVGLDFVVDDARRLVTIRPMSSKTWFMNIGNRRSTYTSADTANSGTTTGTSGTGASALTSGMSGTNTGLMGTTGLTSGYGTTGSTGMGISSGLTGTSGTTGTTGTTTGTTGVATGTNVIAADEFWLSLSSELMRRLKVMIPREMLGAKYAGAAATPAAPAAGPQQVPAIGGQPIGGAHDLYVEKQVGTYSLNPETGAVTVQAPSWILRDLDPYLRSVQEMYNTDITFIGEILLVNSTDLETEGLDVSAIASWAAGRYGAVISNNALGGVTISMPTGSVPSVSAGAQQAGGALVGVSQLTGNNPFNIFNAYLQQRGAVSIIQKPTITTTSGVSGVFEKKVTDYYNTISQQASTGNVGTSSVATQNQLVQYETGTTFRVHPRIDVATGLIRSPLVLNMTIKTGEKTIMQSVSSNNTVQQVPQIVPKLTHHKSQGEILLREGDLIVVGGQVDDQNSIDNNGLPSSTGDNPVGGLFGLAKAQKVKQTYYFALRVVVNKRK